MQRNFFACASDLASVLDQVEGRHRVGYVAAGLFAEAAGQRLDRSAVLAAPDRGTSSSYLVLPEETEVVVRSVPQRRGGVLLAVDALANPSSVVLSPGGRLGPSMLLAGMVGTGARNPHAEGLYRAFAAAVGAGFQRQQSYWVGPAAMLLLRDGVRLARSATAPMEYDLSADDGAGQPGASPAGATRRG